MAFVAFGLVAAPALIWVPKLQVASLKGQATAEVVFDRENEARRTIAQILGGAFLLGSLYAALRRVKVEQEGQITDRFSRAVEHLGHDKLDVRLGGIYALERIAKDSKDDHWTVMEVLTAYVRERAPWPPREPREPQQEDPSKPPEHRPATDIQAVLTVLGRRPRFREERDDQGLDLRRTDLRGSTLRKAQLARVILAVANLTRAYLRDADLTSTNLIQANLSRAHLLRADLTGAFLVEANLTGAFLGGANLTGAFLPVANLTRADLQEANLRGVDLSGVKGLTQDDIDMAITDENTRLPHYLRKPADPHTDTKEPNP